MAEGQVVKVRRANLEDVPRIAEINRLTWQRAYAGIVPAGYLDQLDPTVLQERWTERVTQETPGVHALVAELDGVLAGYIAVGPYRTQEDAEPGEDTAGWGEVFALYTDPDLQGRGAGTAIHDAALELLRAQRCHRAALWVLTANHAGRQWYAARGWRPDGATSEWSDASEPLEEVRLVRQLDT